MSNRIAVEEWGLYNNGVLACKWWDAESSMKDINKHYQALRKKHGVFPADDLELFIADFETELETKSILDENTMIDKALGILGQIDGLNDDELERVSYLMEMEGIKDIETAIESIEDIIVYDFERSWNIDEDFGIMMAEEIGIFTQETAHLEHYFNFAAYGRSFLHDGYTKHNGKVFYFSK